MTEWFVLFSLFFPRLTLFVCWLLDAMPPNSTPLLLDVVAFLIAPRLLIAAWLWATPEWGAPWALLFVFASLVSKGAETQTARSRWEVKEADRC